MEEYRKRQAEKYARMKEREEFERYRLLSNYHHPVVDCVNTIKGLEPKSVYFEDMNVLPVFFEGLQSSLDEIYRVVSNKYAREFDAENRTVVMEAVMAIIEKMGDIVVDMATQQLARAVHTRINDIMKVLTLDPVDFQIDMDTSGDEELAAKLYAEFSAN